MQSSDLQAQSQRPLLDIKVNGDTRVRLAFDAAPEEMAHGEDSGSTSFSIKLQAGDRVWVESFTDTTNNLWGNFHTFFSGALLYSR